MGLNVISSAIILFSLLLLLASTAKAQSNGVFDVTKYGGKQDITAALTNAWKDACASMKPSKVRIPSGTYSLRQVTLAGPCKAAIELQVNGILKAPVNPNQFSGGHWVNFRYIDQLTLSGSGTFDGQGNVAWSKSDDCISVGDGTEDLHVTGVTCGPGHGISVGSLGRYPNEKPVSGIFVKNCTISNTANGVRIKSWPDLYGGDASNMHFEDIVMNNVQNPVAVDQEYCPWNQCSLKAPSKVKISDVSFKNIRGTSATPVVVKLACSSGIPCKKVELADINLVYSGSEGPAKSQCSNVKPIISGIMSASGC
ncbi:hypothetical protein OIU85_003341 [Salix viminalis]|uniref:Pectate lyase superfamily protein domain-containing protein n=1 Tax=Salix viminalis TaxID=40686 RepID=A0A9Q0PZC9_SALVM|nr:hypothetical protein OIU85_003341 [Salix viminalis]